MIRAGLARRARRWTVRVAAKAAVRALCTTRQLFRRALAMPAGRVRTVLCDYAQHWWRVPAAVVMEHVHKMERASVIKVGPGQTVQLLLIVRLAGRGNADFAFVSMASLETTVRWTYVKTVEYTLRKILRTIPEHVCALTMVSVQLQKAAFAILVGPGPNVQMHQSALEIVQGMVSVLAQETTLAYVHVRATIFRKYRSTHLDFQAMIVPSSIARAGLMARSALVEEHASGQVVLLYVPAF